MKRYLPVIALFFLYALPSTSYGDVVREDFGDWYALIADQREDNPVCLAAILNDDFSIAITTTPDTIFVLRVVARDERYEEIFNDIGTDTISLRFNNNEFIGNEIFTVYEVFSTGSGSGQMIFTDLDDMFQLQSFMTMINAANLTNDISIGLHHRDLGFVQNFSLDGAASSIDRILDCNFD